VSNVFYDMDLRTALADLSASTGVPIVASVAVGGVVSCELFDVPLGRALEILLAGTGFVARWTGDFYFVGSDDPNSRSYWQVAEPRRLPLKYLESDVAHKMMPQSLRPYIVPDPAGHCLSVYAPSQIIGEIEDMLEKIDLPPRQIMLEARVVTMEKAGMARIGASWGWPGLQGGANASDGTWDDITWVATAGLTPAGEVTDALMVELDLLAANDEAFNLANPRVLAYEGREARIAVTNEEYFKILTEDFYQRSTLEKVETGIVLKLTPRIGDGGQIGMDIAVEVSDVVARGEEDLPVVTRRTTNSRALVPDHGTVVISGLTDHRERSTTRKVPLLGWLPLVGRLFTYDSSENRESQVAVFITPKIVEVPEPDMEAIARNRQRIELVGEEFEEKLRALIENRRGDGDG
jgi:type II secretory pathway component GspD/PulD (secretin)